MFGRKNKLIDLHNNIKIIFKLNKHMLKNLFDEVYMKLIKIIILLIISFTIFFGCTVKKAPKLP